MSAQLTPAIADTSVWIAFLREGKAEGFIRRSLRTRTVLLAGVAAYELHLGATSRDDKRDLDRIRAAFVAAGLVATPSFEDWCDAALILTRHSRAQSALDPRVHLIDLLVVLCAARLRARVVTWNVRDLRRWNRMLPSRRRVRIELPPDH